MKTLVGYQYTNSHATTPGVPVYWDSDAVVNPHMLILGASGTGKSVKLNKLITGATGELPRVHIMDLHGDLGMPGESVVEFSEQSLYGLNPLVVNPDPRFGGVRKCIEAFIRTLKQVSGKNDMGYKQESVIRNLLTDVFANFGFHIDDPSTWSMNALDNRLVSSGRDNRLYLEVPIAEKDEAKALGARWAPEHMLWWVQSDKYEGGLKKWKPAIRLRRYPAIQDIADYCEQIYRERFLGSDQAAIRALEEVNRKAKSVHRKKMETFRSGFIDPNAPSDSESLADAKESLIEAFTKYVNKINTGQELDVLLKYDKPEILKGVHDRLVAMMRSGVFSAKMPDFDPNCRIWRYKLDALFDEEKKMFVLFMLHKLFRDAVQGGMSPHLHTLVVLDELHALLSGEDDKGDGIIGKIAREARKYGMGLWGATQQLTGIPEGLMTSVGSIVILGLSETYWQSATTKLRIELKQLQFIQPHRTLSAQIKEKGSFKTNWRWLMDKPTFGKPN